MSGELQRFALSAWMDAALWTWLLVTLRWAPLLFLVPAFGGLRASPSLRAGTLACLTLACWPALVVPPELGAEAARLVLSQLAVGVASAVAAMAVFETARVVGALADVALGRGSFGGADPMTGAGAGPLETLHALGIVAVFCSIGGLRLLIGAFVAGLDTWPLDALLDATTAEAWVAGVVAATGAALRVGVAAAIPLLVAALLIDAALGWFGRALPSLQAMFLAMPARAVAGWLVVATTLALTVTHLAPLVVSAFAGALP